MESIYVAQISFGYVLDTHQSGILSIINKSHIL